LKLKLNKKEEIGIEFKRVRKLFLLSTSNKK
jgi:hypothetical protein